MRGKQRLFILRSGTFRGIGGITMAQQKVIEINPETKKRLQDAEQNYQKILQEITPFLRKRKIKSHSTYGKWKSSCIEGA